MRERPHATTCEGCCRGDVSSISCNESTLHTSSISPTEICPSSGKSFEDGFYNCLGIGFLTAAPGKLDMDGTRTGDPENRQTRPSSRETLSSSLFQTVSQSITTYHEEEPESQEYWLRLHRENRTRSPQAEMRGLPGTLEIRKGVSYGS